MSTMLAARLIEPGKPLRVEEVPIPKPAPDEILLEVHACGLCGTDIHLAIDGDIPVEHTPITLGHEAAGVVAALGNDTKGFTIGDRVALFPAASCGDCPYCRAGRESLCDKSKVYGMARDGALAHYVVAPARCAFVLPREIPFDVAAIATDGVATPFHALRARGQLQKGETVAVVGCGGLGSHAILIAKMMGASTIVAIDTNAPALERAKALGADLAINPAEADASKVIRKTLGISGVDLALEFVGRAETVEITLRCLGKAGRAVLVGVGMDQPKLPRLISFIGREQSVLGSFGMDGADIRDIYELIAQGRLDLSDSVSARYPLARVNEALQHLATKRDGVVRVVVEPKT